MGGLRVEIVVRGKHIHVPSDLRAAAEEKAGKVTRFLRDVGRIDVEFAAERNPRVADGQVCEILVHVKGNLLTAHSAAADLGAALDLAVDKIERQARKLHERRVSRGHPRRARNDEGWARVPEAGAGTDVVTSGDEPAASGGSASSDGDGSRIVRVEHSMVKPMTPEEAAMQLDLLGQQFFLFDNAESGHAAVIYRRRDGDLGLIEAG